MKKVLILEDNADLAFLLHKRLSGAYETTVFKEGIGFLTRLGQKNSPPDLVILDLMVPGRSGYELLHPIKSRWPQTKIFIYSAHPDYRKRIPDDMIDGFFLKTDNLDELEKAVARSLAG